MKNKVTCHECGHTKIVTAPEVKWKSPSFKESLGTHWAHHCFVDGVLRFKIFCRTEDCKCFIEDVNENKTTEFSGAQMVAFKIIGDILKKEEPMALDATQEKLQKCYTEIWKTQLYPYETKGKPKADDILKREFKWLT